MTASTPRGSRPWSRLSEVDVPTPLSPPSPTLSASKSWTSGEIPIFLDSSHSTSTLQLSVADSSTSSLFPSVRSVGTFGQPVRRSSSTAPRPSSNNSTPTTASFSVLEDGENDWYGAHHGSDFRISASQANASLHVDIDIADRNSPQGHIPLFTQGSISDAQSRTTPHELNEPAHQDWVAPQPHRWISLTDPDVPLSPTPTLLLSPVTSSASEHITDSAVPVHQQRHFRAVSAPLMSHPYLGILDTGLEGYSYLSPQRNSSRSLARPRSNSNPHLPVPGESLHRSLSTRESIPDWLCGMRIELWIDQEGFRAIQPCLEIVSFSKGAGINAAGEILDVAEFAMRRRQTWHFHYAPLDSAPVLRRLTVNGDMNDYISRQASLILKGNGMYAVESTEDKGRIAWKFEYCVEDRRMQGSSKIIEGEKRFTPLRFVCNPNLLSAEHGKKVKLLQFVRKSVTPKLQSVRLGPGTRASVKIVPRIIVPREGRESGGAVSGAVGGSSSSRSDSADATAKQQSHSLTLAAGPGKHNIYDLSLQAAVGMSYGHRC